MTSLDSALLNAFTWLARTGSALVIVGCCMEGAELIISWVEKQRFRKWIEEIFGKSRRRKSVFLIKFIKPRVLKFETLGFAILFIGLGLELFASFEVESIQSKESDRLTRQLDATTKQARDAEKESGQANERASTNELAAKKLEIQLNETKTQLATAQARLNESILDLQNANLPMDIGDQYSFASALKSLAGIQVELRCAADTKAQETAESLFSTFVMAGWPVINRSIIGDIGEQGVVIGYRNGDDSSKNAAYFLLKELTDRNVPVEIIDDPIGNRVRGVPTDAIIVGVFQRPSQLKANLMAVQARQAMLNDQQSKILARISFLSTNLYFRGSKEMATAQKEFNDLNAQQAQFPNELMDLSQQEQKLSEQEDKEISGTNAMTPGIHVYGGSFSGNRFPFAVGTNVQVEMHGVSINPAPLQ